MSRLFTVNMVTLDGYFEGANHDINWHNVDQEFNEFAIAQLNGVGTLIFGRITYEMMASYWPTPAAVTNDPVVAGLMNGLPKIVISRTLEEATWKNSRLIKDNLQAQISGLKRPPGKDLAVLGSANLLGTLMEMDLIDEHRIIVNPVVLGGGTRLFQTRQGKLNLNLMRTKVFGNGNVLLCYEPTRE